MRARVFSRAQAHAAGLTDEQIEAHLRAGRWQRVYRGVYAGFSGPLPWSSRLAAVLLWAGPGAALSHHTAAELSGLVSDRGDVVHVTLPASRRRQPVAGVAVHSSTRLSRIRHPTHVPAQTRVEETVLDLAHTARTLDDAIGWVTAACGRRLTTPARLMEALGDRSRIRWRMALAGMLADVDAGCHSPLETRFLRDVERAHGLPHGSRQAARERGDGRWYDDVYFPEFGVRVELDGHRYHSTDAWSRDRARDNAAVEAGDTVLRYGWADVTERACATAAQLAAVLTRRGWIGAPHRCVRPGCRVRP